jgi:hypothetical protein
LRGTALWREKLTESEGKDVVIVLFRLESAECRKRGER